MTWARTFESLFWAFSPILAVIAVIVFAAMLHILDQIKAFIRKHRQ